MTATLRNKYFCIALLTIGGFASTGRAAVTLASLGNPTLQTLINLGTSPVTVGQYEFSDFGFVDASTGTAPTAGQIQVQPNTTNGNGLQFVSSWFAANGSIVDDVITFDVKTPSQAPIGQISLLSNGTAPVPVSGTFTSTTLISSLPGGSTAAPVLSTYNDGATTPIDTTKPDVNFAATSLFPQPQLHVIDTLIAVSTPANSSNTGGVATESVLQNTFIPATIPEPAQPAWIVLPMAVVVTLPRRRWKLPARFIG